MLSYAVDWQARERMRNPEPRGREEVNDERPSSLCRQVSRSRRCRRAARRCVPRDDASHHGQQECRSPIRRMARDAATTATSASVMQSIRDVADRPTAGRWCRDGRSGQDVWRPSSLGDRPAFTACGLARGADDLHRLHAVIVGAYGVSHSTSNGTWSLSRSHSCGEPMVSSPVSQVSGT